MIFGYMSKRSKYLFVLLLPLGILLQGLTMFFLSVKKKLLNYFPYSFFKATGLNKIARLIMENGKKLYGKFIKELNTSSLGHDVIKDLDISYYKIFKPKDKVVIKTSNELDRYIAKYENKIEEIHENIDVFCGNLYHATIDNYKNDYIVITAIYHFAIVMEPTYEFSPHREFIVKKYLYKYFNPEKTNEYKKHKKICTILAETVCVLTEHYNNTEKFLSTIELIDLVLKAGKYDPDEKLHERLSRQLEQAVNYKKDYDYLVNKIKEVVMENKNLTKEITFTEFKEKLGELAKAIESEASRISEVTEYAFELKNEGNIKGAVENFTEILELSSNKKKYEICKSLLKHESVNYEVSYYNSSAKLYQNLTSEPNCALVYLKRGNARFLDKDIDGAEGDYSKSIDLNPKSHMAYLYLGSIYLSKGKLEKAYENYCKVIELIPESSTGYYNRAIANKTMGRLDEAIIDYNKAIEYEPENADYFCNRGNTFFHQGKLDEAFADACKAIEIDPNTCNAYNNLAFLYASRKKGDNYLGFSTALKYAEKAVEHSRIAAILDTLAAVYARGGMFKEAVEIQTEVYELIHAEGDNKGSDVAAELIEAYKQKKNYIQWKEEKERS